MKNKKEPNKKIIVLFSPFIRKQTESKGTKMNKLFKYLLKKVKEIIAEEREILRIYYQ